MKPRRKKRSYSDEEVAVALAWLEAEGNLKHRFLIASTQLNIPIRTLRQWEKDGGRKQPATWANSVSAEKKEEARVSLADLTKSVAYKALGLLDDSEMADCSSRDLVIIAGVAIDKTQLLTGQPTSIAGTHEGKSDRELDAYIAGFADGSADRVGESVASGQDRTGGRTRREKAAAGA